MKTVITGEKVTKVINIALLVLVVLVLGGVIWYFVGPSQTTKDTTALGNVNGDTANGFNPDLYNAYLQGGENNTGLTDEQAAVAANQINGYLHDNLSLMFVPQDQVNSNVRAVVETMRSKLQLSQLSAKYLDLYKVLLLTDIANSNQTGLFKSGDIVGDLTTYEKSLS